MAAGKKPNTVAMATQLAQPIADAMHLTLWDVRFEKEGSSWFLRIFIDKEGGVDIDECETFSRQMSARLDEEDPIDQSYYLEVGSPGVERELVKDWHFRQYIGAGVNVRFIRPVDGQRDFSGELLSYEDGTVTIALDDETSMSFQRAEAAFVRLIDDYDYSAQSDEE